LVVTGQGQANRALEVIRAAKATLVSLTPQKSSLEDLFMREVTEQREGVRS
jgi:hypothetical protein